MANDAQTKAELEDQRPQQRRASNHEGRVASSEPKEQMMDLQYHVDLLVAVNHEHHKTLLEEAETARLFHQAQQSEAGVSSFGKMLGQVRGQMSALRARVMQA